MFEIKKNYENEVFDNNIENKYDFPFLSSLLFWASKNAYLKKILEKS